MFYLHFRFFLEKPVHIKIHQLRRFFFFVSVLWGTAATGEVSTHPLPELQRRSDLLTSDRIVP